MDLEDARRLWGGGMGLLISEMGERLSPVMRSSFHFSILFGVFFQFEDNGKIFGKIDFDLGSGI